MKKILLVLALLFSANVYADDFEEGVKAFEQQDYQKAKEFYEKACNGGDASGCSNLGGLYYTGKGVPQDFSKAKELYEKACNGGKASGCFNLGELYRAEEGVPQDFSKAKESYKKACDGGLEVGCEKYHSLKQKIEK